MRLERKATVVATIISSILVALKVVVGIASGSVGVLASAIDSALDLIISAFNYFALTKAEKPADSMFNYGRGKIEALAAVIEGTIISVSGVFIFYQAVKNWIMGEKIDHIGTSLLVMSASMILTLALVVFLEKVAKQTNNLVVKSDALHYKSDLYTNGSIVLSLVVVYLSGLNFIDSIIGGAIALYIIYSAYGIIKEGVFILLDGSLEDDKVEAIKQIISSQEGVNGYHYLKTRKSGKTNFVDVHLVFTPDISLFRAHKIGDDVEAKIAKINKEDEWIITIHLDPVDDSKTHDG